MRQIIGRLLLAACMVGVPIGCTHQTGTATNPAVLAPGYANAADQQMGQVLSGANAFYARIQKDSASGAVTLSATEKSALNGLQVALNTANPVYLAYHKGTATQEQAQAAINNVQAAQAAAQNAGVQ